MSKTRNTVDEKSQNVIMKLYEINQTLENINRSTGEIEELSRYLLNSQMEIIQGIHCIKEFQEKDKK